MKDRALKLLRALEDAVVFPRHLLRPAADAGRGIPGLQRWWLPIGPPARPEGRVEAWFLPAPNASPEHPGPAVIFAHGNGELIDQWPCPLEHYRRLGVSILLPEYRGYGRSDGVPTEQDVVADYARWFDRLAAEPSIDAQAIVLHGRSLGGGVVCATLRHRTPAALILQSTFTRIAEVASRFMVPEALVTHRFESLTALGEYRGPLLVLHGRQDVLIAYEHAERLHAAVDRAKLWLFDGDHNAPPPTDAYWSTIGEFLAEALAK